MFCTELPAKVSLIPASVETRLYCPQAFLSLDFLCRDDISESNYTFRDRKELKHLHNVETRLYCPQAFLSLDFQRWDDVSELQ